MNIVYCSFRLYSFMICVEFKCLVVQQKLILAEMKIVTKELLGIPGYTLMFKSTIIVGYHYE